MGASLRSGRRGLFAAAGAIVVATFIPATAGAVTVQVTGDDGNPIVLGGPLAIRNMSPQVSPTQIVTDDEYSLSVTGANGAQVAVPATCYAGTDTPPSPRTVDYVGNGTYTVTLTQYAATDRFCAQPPIRQTQYPFTIDAFVNLGAPAGPALTRNPLSSMTNTVNLPIDLNPGALSTDAFVALNGQVGPDGALVGTATQLLTDTNARTVAVRLDKGPGTYVVVARAEGFNGSSGQFFSAWSQPAQIRAFAPFDFKSITFPDQRGPSYRLRATMNETATSGRVAIAIARGSKGGRYRSFGSVKIAEHAIAKRFRLGRTGTYRIRFKYKGNALVAPGFVVQKVRITRRITFRAREAAALGSPAVGATAASARTATHAG